MRFLAIVPIVLTGCGIGTDFIDETPTVRITPRSLALALGGDPAQVGGELFVPTADGEVIVGDAELSFTSDNLGVVTVDANGQVRAVGPGQARVTGVYDGDADWTPSGLESLVTVVGDPDGAAQITLTRGGAPAGEAVELSIDGTLQLAAEVRTFDDRPVTGAAVVWASTAPAVATVDTSGLVTPVAAGTTEITAAVAGISSLALTLSVFDPSTAGRVAAFFGVNNYDVEGDATLAFNDQGALELELSDSFRSQNGPDLDVVLSTGPTISGSSVNLGDLQSTRGAQVYAVPDGVSLDQFSYVIIQCVRFGVAFGRAEFQ